MSEENQDFEAIDNSEVIETGSPSLNEPEVDNTTNLSSSNQTAVDSANPVEEKVNENKGKYDYHKKASSSEKAFKNKLNNKNYYDDKLNKNNAKRAENDKKLKENQEKQNDLRNKIERNKQNNNNNNNKANSNKNNQGEDANNNNNNKQDEKDLKKLNKENDSLEKQNKKLEKEEKLLNKDKKKADRWEKFHFIKSKKMKINNAINKVKKLIIMKVLIPVILVIVGIFLAIFVLEAVLGPIIEAFLAIDKQITNIADAHEMVSNLYHGFGLQNSKDAFYDEINDLSKKYDYQLDVSLLLSTVFYPETYNGYGTAYGEAESSGVVDESMLLGIDSSQDASRMYNGLLPFLKAKIKEKVDESHATIDDNGLTYTVGKIYRLRKLARNQFSTGLYGVPLRDGDIRTVSLSSFLNTFEEDLKDFLCAVIGALLGPPSDIKDAILSGLVGGKYTNELLQDVVDAYENLALSAKDLVCDIFIGFASIEDVDWDWSNWDISRPIKSIGDVIKIKYHTYKYDEEGYKAYLKNYYIPNMPEFKKLLPENETAKDAKIDQIIREIYSNKKTFEEIFLKYQYESSEDYSDTCLGAIDQNLVSELRVPIDIASGKTINFDSDNSFGIINGVTHKGVDLTNSNSGVNEGDNVYVVASGKVEDVGVDSASTSGNTNISNFLFIGDSRYNGLKNKLNSYGAVAAVDSSTSSQWKNVVSTGSGKVRENSITLPDSVSGVSVMLGVNDLNVTDLQDVLNKLHERYPSVIIYVNSVYHVGVSYTGSATNEKIDNFNNQMISFCNSNSSWAKYIDVTSELYESDGNLKSSYSSDGLHITNDTGKTKIVNNITGLIGGSSSSIDDGGAWIKISHDIVIDNKDYKFYTVYKNLGTSSITLNKGDNVSKGDVVGKVGKTNTGNIQLHFEFRNESDNPIDPTNLFIKCSNGSGGTYPGDTVEAKIINALLGSGFNYMQTASVITNIFYESTYRPEAVNSLGCTGISQWCYGRQKNLTNYASSLNKSNLDIDVQLDFLLGELTNVGTAAGFAAQNSININVYKSTIDHIKDYTDADEAVEYYCNHFEVPGTDICASRRKSGKGEQWLKDIKSQTTN